jgi:hypothetical protein
LYPSLPPAGEPIRFSQACQEKKKPDNRKGGETVAGLWGTNRERLSLYLRNPSYYFLFLFFGTDIGLMSNFARE